MKDVDSESTKTWLRNGEIELEFAGKIFKLLFIHQLDGRLFHHFRRHLKLVDRHDFAVNLDFCWCKRCKEKVRGFFLDHQFKKRLDVHVI